MQLRKHCLQHIPRVAERNLDPDEEYSNVTVKVGFKKAIRGIELASAIENYVRIMNLVRIHGSRVVLKYVLGKVQRGLPVGNLQSSEGGIMRQLFVGAFHYFHKGIAAGLDNEDIALSIHEYVMLAKIRQCDLPGLPVGNLQSSEGGIMRQLFVGAFHYFHKGIGAGLDNEDIALSIHEYVMLAKIRKCDLPSIEGLSKSIDTVVMQYQTNCQVYVSTTLWGR
ncbi:hypothetical protein MP638_000236, partial [Amoeboaphelidium occidentale]